MARPVQTAFESKKAIALFVTLGVVLIVCVLGVIFHSQVTDAVKWIVALCSGYHASQGTVDTMVQYKQKVSSVVGKVENYIAPNPSPANPAENPAPETPDNFIPDDQDRYANR